MSFHEHMVVASSTSQPTGASLVWANGSLLAEGELEALRTEHMEVAGSTQPATTRIAGVNGSTDAEKHLIEGDGGVDVSPVFAGANFRRLA